MTVSLTVCTVKWGKCVSNIPQYAFISCVWIRKTAHYRQPHIVALPCDCRDKPSLLLYRSPLSISQQIKSRIWSWYILHYWDQRQHEPPSVCRTGDGWGNRYAKSSHWLGEGGCTSHHYNGESCRYNYNNRSYNGLAFIWDLSVWPPLLSCSWFSYIQGATVCYDDC